MRRDPLAQLVEHLTFNQGVDGSNPSWITSFWPVGQAVKTPPFHGDNMGSIPIRVTNLGRLAQLGERLPYKQDVGSSILSSPTKNAAPWCSGLTCRPVTAEIDGSNPFGVAIYAAVAQSVEQRTENPRVDGSIPPCGTIEKTNPLHGLVF